MGSLSYLFWAFAAVCSVCVLSFNVIQLGFVGFDVDNGFGTLIGGIGYSMSLYKLGVFDDD